MTQQHLSCFKAYDIRGRVPDQLDERLARQIGLAYAKVVAPKRVVVGHDIRLSSPSLAEAVADGLRDGGVEVVWIGTCGTEQVYFATFHLGVDGGIMVTASHNPKDYNGMKFVRELAKPTSGDTGLKDIEQAVLGGDLPTASHRGALVEQDITEAYIEHLLGYIDVDALAPLKVVVNAGNGGAGAVIDQLEKRLPLTFIKVHHEPDGTFPHGVPNPLLPENREATATAVKEHGADLGLAWDGDFDRCFFFDERGEFVEGYYIVGLLATRTLKRHPGAKIIHDPRLTWNTLDLVEQAGGQPVQSKTGHAFIKERMRAEDAIYGGEMSAHHYFKEFSYCDSGMIPWLLAVEELSAAKAPLSSMIEQRQKAFPASGEINRRLQDPDKAIARVRSRYEPVAESVDETDGVSIELKQWRFNLRKSNTEPVVRLNVESKGDEALMREKTEEILAMLTEQPAHSS